MIQDHPQTLTEWARLSRDDRDAAVRACVDRIRDRDRALHAWVRVSPLPATGDGPLADIPVGVKDIIDTRDLPTELGSPLYAGRIADEDAAIVRDLRQLGAVVLGKTETAAFAYRTPAPTRNPRDLEHTPGGSSSGSAAAVAAGMVPFAIGTQTLGSIVRPASFCGVTGFKPSHGLLAMDGVLPCAPSLDTLGFFTHTAEDMLWLWQALGHEADASADCALGVPDPMPEVDSPMAAAFAAAVSRLRGSGLEVRPVGVAAILALVRAASTTIMAFEAARVHERRYAEHGSRLRDLADLVRAGQETSLGSYEEAKRAVVNARAAMTTFFASTPIILTPAATGPAPRGLTSTGDPRMNAPWTALGTPALSIPMPVGEALPLGLQLTAAHGDDARAIGVAIRLQHALGADRAL